MTEQRLVILVVVATLIPSITATIIMGSLFLPVLQANVQTASGNTLQNIPGGDLLCIGVVLSLCIPFLILALYVVYGRERRTAIVPEYLSCIPDTSFTPRQVNILFRDSPIESDEFGFYATLLDLQRKKKIDITSRPEKRGVIIRILDSGTDDPYERQVLDFFLLYSKEGRFDTGDIESLLPFASGKSSLNESAPLEDFQEQKVIRQFNHDPADITGENLLVKFRSHLLHLMYSGDRQLSRQYFSSGIRLLPLYLAGLFLSGYAADMMVKSDDTMLLPLGVFLLLGGLVVIPIVICLCYFAVLYGKMVQKIAFAIESIFAIVVLVYLMVTPPAGILMPAWILLFGLIILIQASIATFFSLPLFYRWNAEYYREKLQWDAFGRFLSDVGRIEQYNHENTRIWGEWLVYGTALGVGERVGKAGMVMGLDWCYPESMFGEFPWYGHFHMLILPSG